jgi:hypothetical protein
MLTRRMILRLAVSASIGLVPGIWGRPTEKAAQAGATILQEAKIDVPRRAGRGQHILVSQERRLMSPLQSVERGEHPRLRWGQEKGENDDRTLASDYVPTTQHVVFGKHEASR